MPSTTPAIALLLCDTPLPAVVAEHGDYTTIFNALLTVTVPIRNPEGPAPFRLDSFDVVNKMEYPSDDDLDQYDAIMMTGSAASAYANEEWINKLVMFTARVANTKPHIKIIGICFGHQIVARAMGGECVPNNGRWEVGVTPLDLTYIGKKLFGVETLNIQQMHRDHVPSVPQGFENLGSTDVSVVQGLVKFNTPTDRTVDKLHIFTVQGHPEFTEPIVSKVVDARSKSGAMDAATTEDAIRRKDWRNDGYVVASVILKMLGVV